MYISTLSEQDGFAMADTELNLQCDACAACQDLHSTTTPSEDPDKQHCNQSVQCV